MKQSLRRKVTGPLVGQHPDLSGSCSGLSGNCTGLSGNCSGLSGNLDLCALTSTDRIRGVAICRLVAEKE